MRARFWLAGLTVIAAALGTSARAALLLTAPGEIGGIQQSAGQESGTWTAEGRSNWRDDDGSPRLQINLRTGDGSDRWGFGARVSELQGLPPAARDGSAADVTFRLVREVGTVTFSGSFDDGRGAGRYAFAPNATYIAAMRELGHPDMAGARMMRLALLDVTTAFVRELRQAGRTSLPLDDLVRFRIHGVSGAIVRGFEQAGLTGLAPDALVRLRIHKVTAEFIQGLKTRRYTGLDADDLTRMRIHGVTLEEIDALVAAGMRDVSADDLVKFRIHKVTPAFIREMRAVGFATADEDDFVRMRIHKVSAEFVRSARADGLEVLNADDAVDLAIHGRRVVRARRR